MHVCGRRAKRPLLTSKGKTVADEHDNTVTPKELALELGVTDRSIRVYLRSKYGTLPAFETRWHLSSERAAGVREHFSR